MKVSVRGEGKTAVKKICCLGMGQAGVPMGAVIAIKCPEIKVTIVHLDREDIFLWNAKQIPSSVCAPGLEEIIRKVQNKNLFFTTNDDTSIKEADMIFIISKSKLKSSGEGKGETLDMSQVEDAAAMIAKAADSNKIVVENSAIPYKTAECVRKTLDYNSHPGVKFQVLSNPEFYEEGSPIQNLIAPDRVLIGYDNTAEGLAAAKELSAIFERWIRPSNILLKDGWTTELSQIGSSALAAQSMASMYSLSIICEEARLDIKDIVNVMEKDSRLASGFLETNLGRSKMLNSVANLVYICESLNLSQAAEHWKQVLEMNKYHKKRFFSKLIWSLNQTAWNRKIVIMGFSYFRGTTVTEGSPAIDLCKYLLNEHAMLSIYDPKVTQEQVLKDLLDAGCATSSEFIENQVMVFSDPYRAVVMSQVIVICKAWKEFQHLDFVKIFQDMVKPAYLFDGGNFLPHQELLKIGYKVYTVGKFIENK